MSREARRAQLIASTIETLAARGYSRITLTDVARAAGLQYDALVRGAESALPMAEDGELPSGDEIAEQLEAFLREMDDDKGRSE